ncbi:hypothetical protein [Roseiconus lacunae]|uniref:Uncharacterized protein n=1 Tax=Roseiconus lacunae TaxID=2605694 RepID=A0ABT7PNX4_9BACT|nr:hypothetical protein [Roseiconus lacunae]MDM4018208.1 hypothetical protein [Roseiconus lacunae]
MIEMRKIVRANVTLLALCLVLFGDLGRIESHQVSANGPTDKYAQSDSVSDPRALAAARDLIRDLSLIRFNTVVPGLDLDGGLRFAQQSHPNRDQVEEGIKNVWLEQEAGTFANMLASAGWLRVDKDSVTVANQARKWAQALPSADDPQKAWDEHWATLRGLAKLENGQAEELRVLMRNLYAKARRSQLGYAEADTNRADLMARVLDATLAMARARGRMEFELRKPPTETVKHDSVTARGFVEQGLSTLVGSEEFNRARHDFDRLSGELSKALNDALTQTELFWANPKQVESFNAAFLAWESVATAIEEDRANRLEMLLRDADARAKAGINDLDLPIAAALATWESAEETLRQTRKGAAYSSQETLKQYIRIANGEWADAYAFFEGLDPLRRRDLTKALAERIEAVASNKTPVADAKRFAQSVLGKAEWARGKITKRERNKLVVTVAQAIQTRYQSLPAEVIAKWKDLQDRTKQIEKQIQDAAQQQEDKTREASEEALSAAERLNMEELQNQADKIWEEAKEATSLAWQPVLQNLVVREWATGLAGKHQVVAGPITLATELTNPELVSENQQFRLEFGVTLGLVVDANPAEFDTQPMLGKLPLVYKKKIAISIPEISVDPANRNSIKDLANGLQATAKQQLNELITEVAKSDNWKYDPSTVQAFAEKFDVWGSRFGFLPEQFSLGEISSKASQFEMLLTYFEGDDELVLHLGVIDAPSADQRENHYRFMLQALLPGTRGDAARKANLAQTAQLSKTVARKLWRDNIDTLEQKLTGALASFAPNLDSSKAKDFLAQAVDTLNLRWEREGLVFSGSLNGKHISDQLDGFHTPFRGRIPIRTKGGQPSITIDLSRVSIDPRNVLSRFGKALKFVELQSAGDRRYAVMLVSDKRTVARLGELHFEKDGKVISPVEATEWSQAKFKANPIGISLTLPPGGDSQESVRFDGRVDDMDWNAKKISLSGDLGLPFELGSFQGVRVSIGSDGVNVAPGKEALQQLARQLATVGMLPYGMSVSSAKMVDGKIWLELAGGDDKTRKAIQPLLQPISRDSLTRAAKSLGEWALAKAADELSGELGSMKRLLQGKLDGLPDRGRLATDDESVVVEYEVRGKPKGAKGKLFVPPFLSDSPIAELDVQPEADGNPLQLTLTREATRELQALIESRARIPSHLDLGEKLRFRINADKLILKPDGGYFEICPPNGKPGIPISVQLVEGNDDNLNVQQIAVVRILLAVGPQGMRPPRFEGLKESVTGLVEEALKQQIREQLGEFAEVWEKNKNDLEAVVRQSIQSITPGIEIRGPMRALPDAVPGVDPSLLERLRETFDVPTGYEFDMVWQIASRSIEVKNVRFWLMGSAAGPDLSQVDTSDLRNTVGSMLESRLKLPGDAASIEIADVTPRRDGVDLRIAWQFRVDALDVVVRGEQRLELSLDRVGLGGDNPIDLIIDGVLTALVQRLGEKVASLSDIPVAGENLTMDPIGARRTDGGCVSVYGQAVIASDVLKAVGLKSLAVPIEVLIPIKPGSRPSAPKIKVNSDDVKKKFKDAVAKLSVDSILGELGGLEFLTGDPFSIEVKSVTPLFSDSDLPKGVRLALEAGITLAGAGYGCNLPDVLIDDRGVRLEGPKYLKFTNKSLAPFVPIVGSAGFQVSGFEVGKIPQERDGKRVELTQAVLICDAVIAQKTEDVLSFRGRFAITLEPDQLGVSGNAKLRLVSIAIASAGFEARFNEGLIEGYVSFGGPIRKFIRGDGEFKIDVPALKFDGSTEFYVFNIVSANAGFEIDIDDLFLQFGIDAHIPLTTVSLTFNSGERFSNPMLRGKTEVKVVKVTLSGMDLEQSLRQMRAGFTVLGFRLGITLPSVFSLNEDLLWRLIKNLLFPDLANLHKALLALLSGNVEINPFAGFGPGGDSFDGGGEDGGQDGSEHGDEGEGESRAKGSDQFKAPAALDDVEAEVETEEPAEGKQPAEVAHENAGTQVNHDGELINPAELDEPAFALSADEKQFTFVGNEAMAKKEGVPVENLELPIFARNASTYQVRTQSDNGVWKTWQYTVGGGVSRYDLPGLEEAQLPPDVDQPRKDGDRRYAWAAQLIPTTSSDAPWAIVVLRGENADHSRQGWIDASRIGLSADPLMDFKASEPSRHKVLQDLLEHAAMRLAYEPKRRWPRRAATDDEKGAGLLAKELVRIESKGGAFEYEALMIRFSFDREFRVFVRFRQRGSGAWQLGKWGMWDRADLAKEEELTHVRDALTMLMENAITPEPEFWVGARFEGDTAIPVHVDELRFSDDWSEKKEDPTPTPPPPPVPVPELVELRAHWKPVAESENLQLVLESNSGDTPQQIYHAKQWRENEEAFQPKDDDANKFWPVARIVHRSSSNSDLGQILTRKGDDVPEDERGDYLVAIRAVDAPVAVSEIDAVRVASFDNEAGENDLLNVAMHHAMVAYTGMLPGERGRVVTPVRLGLIPRTSDGLPTFAGVSTTGPIAYARLGVDSGDARALRFLLSTQTKANEDESEETTEARIRSFSITLHGESELLEQLEEDQALLEDLVLLAMHRNRGSLTLYPLPELDAEEGFVLLDFGSPEVWLKSDEGWSRARLGQVVTATGHQAMTSADFAKGTDLHDLAVSMLLQKVKDGGGQPIPTVQSSTPPEEDELSEAFMLVKRTDDNQRTTMLAMQREGDSNSFDIAARKSRRIQASGIENTPLYQKAMSDDEHIRSLFERFKEIRDQISQSDAELETFVATASKRFQIPTDDLRNALVLRVIDRHCNCVRHLDINARVAHVVHYWSALKRRRIRGPDLLEDLTRRGALPKGEKDELPPLTFRQTLSIPEASQRHQRIIAVRAAFEKSAEPFWSAWKQAKPDPERNEVPEMIQLKAAITAEEGGNIFSLAYTASDAEVRQSLGLGNPSDSKEIGSWTLQLTTPRAARLIEGWKMPDAYKDPAERTMINRCLLDYLRDNPSIRPFNRATVRDGGIVHLEGQDRSVLGGKKGYIELATPLASDPQHLPFLAMLLESSLERSGRLQLITSPPNPVYWVAGNLYVSDRSGKLKLSATYPALNDDDKRMIARFYKIGTDKLLGVAAVDSGLQLSSTTRGPANLIAYAQGSKQSLTAAVPTNGPVIRLRSDDLQLRDAFRSSTSGAAWSSLREVLQERSDPKVDDRLHDAVAYDAHGVPYVLLSHSLTTQHTSEAFRERLILLEPLAPFQVSESALAFLASVADRIEGDQPAQITGFDVGADANKKVDDETDDKENDDEKKDDAEADDETELKRNPDADETILCTTPDQPESHGLHHAVRGSPDSSPTNWAISKRLDQDGWTEVFIEHQFAIRRLALRSMETGGQLVQRGRPPSDTELELAYELLRHNPVRDKSEPPLAFLCLTGDNVSFALAGRPSEGLERAFTTADNRYSLFSTSPELGIGWVEGTVDDDASRVALTEALRLNHTEEDGAIWLKIWPKGLVLRSQIQSSVGTLLHVEAPGNARGAVACRAEAGQSLLSVLNQKLDDESGSALGSPEVKRPAYRVRPIDWDLTLSEDLDFCWFAGAAKNGLLIGRFLASEEDATDDVRSPRTLVAATGGSDLRFQTDESQLSLAPLPAALRNPLSQGAADATAQLLLLGNHLTGQEKPAEQVALFQPEPGDMTRSTWWIWRAGSPATALRADDTEEALVPTTLHIWLLSEVNDTWASWPEKLPTLSQTEKIASRLSAPLSSWHQDLANARLGTAFDMRLNLSHHNNRHRGWQDYLDDDQNSIVWAWGRSDQQLTWSDIHVGRTVRPRLQHLQIRPLSELNSPFPFEAAGLRGSPSLHRRIYQLVGNDDMIHEWIEDQPQSEDQPGRYRLTTQKRRQPNNSFAREDTAYVQTTDERHHVVWIRYASEEAHAAATKSAVWPLLQTDAATSSGDVSFRELHLIEDALLAIKVTPAMTPSRFNYDVIQRREDVWLRRCVLNRVKIPGEQVPRLDTDGVPVWQSDLTPDALTKHAAHLLATGLGLSHQDEGDIDLPEMELFVEYRPQDSNRDLNWILRGREAVAPPVNEPVQWQIWLPNRTTPLLLSLSFYQPPSLELSSDFTVQSSNLALRDFPELRGTDRDTAWSRVISTMERSGTSQGLMLVDDRQVHDSAKIEPGIEDESRDPTSEPLVGLFIGDVEDGASAPFGAIVPLSQECREYPFSFESPVDLRYAPHLVATRWWLLTSQQEGSHSEKLTLSVDPANSALIIMNHEDFPDRAVVIHETAKTDSGEPKLSIRILPSDIVRRGFLGEIIHFVAGADSFILGDQGEEFMLVCVADGELRRWVRPPDLPRGTVRNFGPIDEAAIEGLRDLAIRPGEIGRICRLTNADLPEELVGGLISQDPELAFRKSLMSLLRFDGEKRSQKQSVKILNRLFTERGWVATASTQHEQTGEIFVTAQWPPAKTISTINLGTHEEFRDALADFYQVNRNSPLKESKQKPDEWLERLLKGIEVSWPPPDTIRQLIRSLGNRVEAW